MGRAGPLRRNVVQVRERAAAGVDRKRRHTARVDLAERIQVRRRLVDDRERRAPGRYGGAPLGSQYAGRLVEDVDVDARTVAARIGEDRPLPGGRSIGIEARVQSAS